MPTKIENQTTSDKEENNSSKKPKTKNFVTYDEINKSIPPIS